MSSKYVLMHICTLKMLERARIERNAITWCQKLKSHERNHPPVQSRSGTKYEFQSDGFEKFPKPQYLFLCTYQNVCGLS